MSINGHALLHGEKKGENTLTKFNFFFSRSTGPISTKLRTKHPWVKGIQACSNKETVNSQKEDNGFFSSPYQRYDMIDLYCFLR